MTACPTNAITINPATGAKIVLDEVCVGCALCVVSCPYGTVFYNPTTHKAFKCDLCSGEPACATACPTDAIEYEEVTPGDWLPTWGDQVTARYLRKLEGGVAA